MGNLVHLELDLCRSALCDLPQDLVRDALAKSVGSRSLASFPEVSDICDLCMIGLLSH